MYVPDSPDDEGPVLWAGHKPISALTKRHMENLVGVSVQDLSIHINRIVCIIEYSAYFIAYIGCVVHQSLVLCPPVLVLHTVQSAELRYPEVSQENLPPKYVVWGESLPSPTTLSCLDNILKRDYCWEFSVLICSYSYGHLCIEIKEYLEKELLRQRLPCTGCHDDPPIRVWLANQYSCLECSFLKCILAFLTLVALWIFSYHWLLTDSTLKIIHRELLTLPAEQC